MFLFIMLGTLYGPYLILIVFAPAARDRDWGKTFSNGRVLRPWGIPCRTCLPRSVLLSRLDEDVQFIKSLTKSPNDPADDLEAPIILAKFVSEAAMNDQP